MLTDLIEEQQQAAPQPAQPPAQDGYEFADGDLSQFIEEMKRPKQDMGIDEMPDENDPYFATGDDGAPSGDGAELDPDNPQTPLNIPLRDARQMARGLVIGGDELIANIFGAFNEGDPAPFHLDEEQKQQVTESLALVMKYNHAQVSPGWGLAILLLAIYGGKVTLLVQLRKERAEKKELKAEIERLKKQLEDEQRRNDDR